MDVVVDNNFEPFRGVNEHFVTLRGSIDGIIDALDCIIKKLPKQ